VRISLVACGRCGKPRGLFHACVYRIGRRPGRTRIRPRVTCGSCGKPVRNLRHVCTTRTDFRKRRNAARRAEATARRRAKRKAATQRRRERARARRKTRASSPPKPRHDYRNCREPDCQRQACQAWREGVEAGVAAVLGEDG